MFFLMAKTKNIIVLTYWSFPDALIQSYTLPYVKIMSDVLKREHKIYLVTLEKKPLSNEQKETIRKELMPHNIHPVFLKYTPFGGKAIALWGWYMFKLWMMILSKSISHIHCWCTPPGVIGYYLSKLTGRKLVLDSFEPHAEPMLESETWDKTGKAFRILFKHEKKQLMRAKEVIFCVDKMKDYCKEKYGYSPSKYHVKPACVNMNHFSFDLRKDQELIKELNLENKIIGVYAGKFGGNYFQQEVFRLIKAGEDYWGDQFRFLILSSHTKEEINGFAEMENVSNSTIIHRFLPHDEVPKYIGLADFGITPFIPVPSKRYGTPIKTGEYWSMGLPVVITPNISDDSEIINKNKIGVIWNEFDKKGCSECIESLDQLLKESNINQKILSIAQKHRNFNLVEPIYKDIYC